MANESNTIDSLPEQKEISHKKIEKIFSDRKEGQALDHYISRCLWEYDDIIQGYLTNKTTYLRLYRANLEVAILTLQDNDIKTATELLTALISVDKINSEYVIDELNVCLNYLERHENGQNTAQQVIPVLKNIMKEDPYLPPKQEQKAEPQYNEIAPDKDIEERHASMQKALKIFQNPKAERVAGSALEKYAPNTNISAFKISKVSAFKPYGSHKELVNERQEERANLQR